MGSEIRVIADLATPYRMPICLHNVSGLLLNLASQQFSAAIHSAPMMAWARGSDRALAAKSNVPVIKNGKMQVHSSSGIGVDLDEDYLRAHLTPGEPWWGELRTIKYLIVARPVEIEHRIIC